MKKRYIIKNDSRAKKKKKITKSSKSDTIKKRIEEKQALFLQLFDRKAANISSTCEAIGISRETYYEWRKRYGKFDQACDDIEMSLIDFAESQLLQNIKAGKETSLIFYLCNRAPDRWKNIQKSEIEINKPIRIMYAGVDMSEHPNSEDEKK